jgi:hypothetical protein
MSTAARKIAATAGTAALLAAVTQTTAAQAQSASRTFRYSCTLSGSSVTIDAVVGADLPDRVRVGHSTGRTPMHVSTELDGTVTSLLRGLKVASVRGTVEAQVTASGAGGTRKIPVVLASPSLAVPASGSLRVAAGGSASPQTFGTAGRVRLSVGGFMLHATGLRADGRQAFAANASCALTGHQSPVVATLQVTGAGGGDGTQPSASPRPSAAAGASGSAGGDADELADTGQSAARLVPVGAGAVVAGAAAVGGAVWLRRRGAGRGV